MSPVLLSPPDVGAAEREALLRAFDSGWIAPLGPEVDAFEAELAVAGDRAHAVALASGTAALHLSLIELGVGPGDDVVAASFTFAATVNPIVYCGARPVLIDSETRSWGLDPALLTEHLETAARAGRLPKAIIAVDLFGQCFDRAGVLAAAAPYDVPVIEDAAEALGSAHDDGRAAGSVGVSAVLSFNGNKMITTSGGGALLTDDADLADRARNRASQARKPAAHYEHDELGYNYRLSNLLAALGRAQLAGLDTKVARRRAIAERYRTELKALPGVDFAPRDNTGRGNDWLSVLTIDPTVTGFDREDLREHLAAAAIETRPVWKPMHQQPFYADAPRLLNGVSDDAFARGLCLPSGSGLSEDDQTRVIETLSSKWSRR